MKSDALWVIPVCYDPANPVVYECIEAIQEFHDRPNIIVVDSSGSKNHDYYDFCIDRGVKIASIHNELYATGAHAWAFVHHPEIDYFYMMFDSLIPTANCDSFREHPLTVLRHWHSSQHDWGWNENSDHLSIWGFQQLERMGIPETRDYHGIMGPIMFAHRSVLMDLYNIGYWFTQTTSSWLHCAQERVAGIALEFLGHDIPSASLQGTHLTHWSEYDESFMRKVNCARA